MLIHAILLTVIAIFAHSSHKFFGDAFLNRPIVVAPLVGLALGDFHTGLIMGGTLELTWMGVMYLGLSCPADVTTGAIIGTAFAILSGSDVSVALTISIPAGILSAYVMTGTDVLSSFAMHKADAYAAVGNLKGVNRVHVCVGIVQALVMGLVTFFVVLLGTDMLSAVVEMIPENVMTGMDVAAGVLPAIGFAMLLNIMWDVRFLPFYFIGFVLAVCFGADIMAVTVLATAFAVFRLLNTGKGEES